MTDAFLTPSNSQITTEGATSYKIDVAPSLLRYLVGSLDDLTHDENWENYGDATPEDVAQYFSEVVYGVRPMHGVKAVFRALRENNQTLTTNDYARVTFDFYKIGFGAEYVEFPDTEFEWDGVSLSPGMWLLGYTIRLSGTATQATRFARVVRDPITAARYIVSTHGYHSGTQTLTSSMLVDLDGDVLVPVMLEVNKNTAVNQDVVGSADLPSVFWGVYYG